MIVRLDLGYYAPSNDLVLYHGDVGFGNGIVRLGRFDASSEQVQGLAEGASITVERSGG